MTLDSLYGRIAVAFAAVLIAFGLLQGALSYAAAKRDQHQVMQQISRGLAAHIADQGRLIGPNGIDRKAVDDLFHMTTAVNPSIDIYLLDGNGWILAHSPRDRPLARDRWDAPFPGARSRPGSRVAAPSVRAGGRRPRAGDRAPAAARPGGLRVCLGGTRSLWTGGSCGPPPAVTALRPAADAASASPRSRTNPLVGSCGLGRSAGPASF